MQIGRVIHQNIQTTVLRRNASKQSLYLLVVTMITAHRNTLPTRIGDGRRRCSYCAGERCVSLMQSSPGTVNRSAGCSQSDRNTFTGPSAGARHYDYSIRCQSHGFSP
jgi:hypothetical protein